MKPWEDRFWSKVEIGDCWKWLGAVNSRGYPQFWDGTRNVYAYRFLWEQLVGSIPEGLTIDHLCQHKRCVNPDHLEVVDRVTNWRRAPHVNTRKQFCPQGHPLVQGKRQRDCLVCFDREYQRNKLRKWRARRRMVEAVLTRREPAPLEETELDRNQMGIW